MVKKKNRESKAKLSARKRAEEHETSGGLTTLTLPEGMKLFGLKSEGVKKINIVPFKAGKGNPYADEGELHFERTYYVHRGIGPNKQTFVCPAKTAGKPCPVCEHRSKLANNPDADEDQQELIKSLFPKERQLWNVENVTEKDGEAGEVQVWDISYHLFGKQLDDRIKNSDDDENYEYFADPSDSGSTLKIGVEEKSFAGKAFYAVNTIDFKAREELSEEVQEGAACLDDLLKIPSYKELQKAFLAMDEDDDEDEDEKPKSKKEKAKSKAKDEDEEDDDDEEEEKPKGKSKSGSSKPAEIKVGTAVEHEEYGICVVTKVVGDFVTLEDEEGETHKKVDKDDLTVIEKKSKSKSKKVEEDDDDDDEDETPPKKSKSKSKKVEEDDDDEDDEDEDEEDEDDDDDEDEEEKPKKKKTSKGKKKSDDDDEDISF